LTVIAFLDVPASIGYPVLFGLVTAESSGALVPGETAVIVAGALAARPPPDHPHLQDSGGGSHNTS